MLKREKIIVLKTFPFSESDVILRGLSSLGVKMNFLAKGALKSRRRFSGGVLNPCSFIEVEYKRSRQSFHRLQQAWFLRDFTGLRRDYDRLSLGLYFVRILDRISTEGGQNDSPELFRLLGQALMEAEKSSHLKNLKLFFQVKLLFLQGILPNPHQYSAILGCFLKEHENFKPTGPVLMFNPEEALKNYVNIS